MALSQQELTAINDLYCQVTSRSYANYYHKVQSAQPLLKEIQRLAKKHGDHPYLINVLAEFVQDSEQRLSLFKKCINIAKKEKDQAALVQATEAVTRIYGVEQKDERAARLWLSLLEILCIDGQPYLKHPLSDTRAQVKRLSFAVVN